MYMALIFQDLPQNHSHAAIYLLGLIAKRAASLDEPLIVRWEPITAEFPVRRKITLKIWRK
jgi:hypothetical protein